MLWDWHRRATVCVYVVSVDMCVSLFMKLSLNVNLCVLECF